MNKKHKNVKGTKSSNYMTEEEKLVIVEDCPWDIRLISNPSERVQLAAAKKDGYIIKYIDNPSKEIQLIAVKDNPRYITFIKNPYENIQLMALENVWTKFFYENYIEDLPNKTDWFYREFNRLKITKGPLK